MSSVQRTFHGLCSVICAVTVGSILFASCRGESATVSALPPPETEDRPPGSAPELPRLYVGLPSAATNSPTRVLSKGDDLQEALNAAKPGDVIALAPGAIFSGPIRLPEKPGSGWITIRTNVADGAFPTRGTRVNPTHAPLMAIIESSSDSAITAESGAHHYRFIGIQVRPQPGSFLYNLIGLGGNETSVEQLPHHIVFERCYVHGDPKVGGRRGIALNSRYTAVVDSYLADFKEQGADSQAVWGANGPGPFTIVNNYLEAAGENVMFGGADPAITNLVPSDIEVRANQLSKPLRWKVGDTAYEGTHWTVKNLFELKNARRVLVEGNLFQYNWADAQNGFAILFTPRNQDGGAPWSMVRDVTFTSNIVQHTGSAMNISGTDDIQTSQQTKRVLIANNVFQDVDGQRWTGAGRLFQLLNGTADVVIDHNTALQSGDIIYAEGAAHSGFVYRNNLTPHNQYGITGRGTARPATLTNFFPGGIFVGNVMWGGNVASYPPGNFFPPSLASVGFVDPTPGNYRLQQTSSYKNAGSDGKDLGADIDAVEMALAGGTIRRQHPARQRAVSRK